MKYLVIILVFVNILNIWAIDVIDPRCPIFNDPFETVHLPNANNCTLFYKCNWGRAILMSCPAGLHFNPTLQVCDWPQEAGCQAESESTTTGQGADTSTLPQTDTTDQAVGETTPDSGLDPRCPSENGQWVVHLPHETNCTLFYKCDWGRAILMSCPAGLHFNPTLQVCDWPQDAGCQAGSESTTTGQGADTSTLPQTDTTDQAVGETTPDSGLDPRCPSENSQWVVHLPHETNCTKFYKCDWGRAILMSCPPGLHFNPTLQVCDWPQDAGCSL